MGHHTKLRISSVYDVILFTLSVGLYLSVTFYLFYTTGVSV